MPPLRVLRGKRRSDKGSSDFEGEFKNASPYEQADLPQSILEPILLRVAAQNGIKVRWDMQFVECHEDSETGKIHSVIRDQVTQERITVISKYLCGADGARSVVARELQLPFNDTPGGGLALNVLVEADMVGPPLLLLPMQKNCAYTLLGSSTAESLPRFDSYSAQARQAAARLLCFGDCTVREALHRVGFRHARQAGRNGDQGEP